MITNTTMSNITILDLPTELLAHIYMILPDQGDKAAFEKTARRFYQISLLDPKRESYIDYFNDALKRKYSLKTAKAIFQLFLKNNVLLKIRHEFNDVLWFFAGCHRELLSNYRCTTKEGRCFSTYIVSLMPVELYKQSIDIMASKGKIKSYQYVFAPIRTTNSVEEDRWWYKNYEIRIFDSYLLKWKYIYNSRDWLFRRIEKLEMKRGLIGDFLDFTLNSLIDFVANKNIKFLSGAIKDVNEMPPKIWCICHKAGMGLIKKISLKETRTAQFRLKIHEDDEKKVLDWDTDHGRHPKIDQLLLYSVISKTTLGFAKWLQLDYTEEDWRNIPN